jgi:hypothetical protein
MWPRIVEIVLALGLIAGSLTLSAGPDLPAVRLQELIPAGLIILVALLSFHPRLRLIYLVQIVLGIWLIAYGFWTSEGPAPPAIQNAILIGALLLMFGVIPSEANAPPLSWRGQSPGAG